MRGFTAWRHGTVAMLFFISPDAALLVHYLFIIDMKSHGKLRNDEQDYESWK